MHLPAPLRSCRYHNVGILVLFLHDVNDIQLEFTKLNVYFKHRGGVYHRLNDVLSNIGCLTFTISWWVWLIPLPTFLTSFCSPPVPRGTGLGLCAWEPALPRTGWEEVPAEPDPMLGLESFCSLFAVCHHRSACEIWLAA